MRVQRYFNQLLRAGPASPVPWFFAVMAELSHPIAASPNRVRAIFEHAVEDRQARRSLLLWRMYVHFEHAQRGAARAKPVFYRCVQVCGDGGCVEPPFI